ncbi:ATP-binding protein [Streptomyces sp. NPDC089424]|uniref:ATP-binding protein n=1 Tax=Streptomyces sp. NPDC089424 TaxID=3365917 RepID=UPI0038071330
MADERRTAMAPPSLPHPVDHLPGHDLPDRATTARQALRLAGADPLDALPGPEHPLRAPSRATRAPQSPGGEFAGRLPGPKGPDRLASGDLPAHRAHTFVLPATPESAGVARRAVRRTLTSWHIHADDVDNAVLVTSELVTNAVTHSGSERIVCRLHLVGRRLRVEVEDQNLGSTLPASRQACPDDQNGRGLVLVEAVCDDWGVGPAPNRTGRVVWADLTTTPSPPVPPTPATPPARPVPHSAEGSVPHVPTAQP